MFQSEGFEGGECSGLSVLGLSSDTTACGHYRVVFPLQTLASKGARVCARVLSGESDPLELGELLAYDNIIIQRHIDPGLYAVCNQARRARGTVLIYDLDDLLLRIPSSSPAFAAFDPKSEQGERNLAGIDVFLEGVDAAIFSTRELASCYKDKVTHSYIIQNGLDVENERWEVPAYDWKINTPGAKEDSLLVGVSGGATHFADWKILTSSIQRILKETNAFIGIHADPTIAKELFEKWAVPKERAVKLPVTSFEDYPHVLKAFDVILAPLQNLRFNLCKSNLRIVESGFLGIPYVASSVAPFHRFHIDSKGIGGFLAQGEDFATSAIRLLKDNQLREKCGLELKEYIRIYNSTDNTARLLPYVLKAARLNRSLTSPLPDPLIVSDIITNRPSFHFPVKARDQCPCGQNHSYGQGCAPAYGRI